VLLELVVDLVSTQLQYACILFHKFLIYQLDSVIIDSGLWVVCEYGRM
jgi:hypothetical protein